ncbi:hypothetical protein ASF61_15890 [Duganella sp. Leaf126]|uniref:hypothetical protein n=1 Tax=Duganella sp. Leaf126 TaxID=1736266 RepID=UPI0006F58AD5|nr:hypothetical protein [Duganella sp. Leaf126]KQQ31835.1 hypothetical protein ASF61_15890 [Duganella sp. Leaf126]
MARDSYAYRQVAVHSVQRRGAVAIHPVPGQAFSPALPVQCSQRLKDLDTYPLGTCFLLDAKLTDRLGRDQYLYAWHGDAVQVLSAQQVKAFLAEFRRGRI